MSISSGLNTAMRALMAQQESINAVSHNIANATTPGFSRQRVRMVSLAPPANAGSTYSQSGVGVEVYDVNRVRDIFADYQMRLATQAEGRYSARASSLQSLELSLNEPSESGLRAVMGRFWNSWRDLGNEPESVSARGAVVEAANTLGATTRRLSADIERLRAEADSRIVANVNEINSLTARIANLNEQIAPIEAGGNEASDLRDQRDLALDELSRLVNVQYQESSDGRLQVYIGGHHVVAGASSWEIVGVPNPANANFIDLRFASDGMAVNVTDGEVRGLLDQRDVDLPARIADLNALAAQIITDVNTAHAAGYGLDGVTGRAFFTGTDATTLAVSAAVVADKNVIATSTTAAGVPGNGANAGAISDIQYAKRLMTNTATFDQFWGSFVSDVGSATREAEGLQEAQGIVLSRLEQVRQGTSGVNLDEEMVQMMSYQRAYEAAARIVRVLDEMLDTLVNRT